MRRGLWISLLLILCLLQPASAQDSGKVALPEDLSTIRDEAFMNNSTIEQVILPDGLISIGNRAFYSCENLSFASIPNSVVAIGKNAFADCAEDFYISCSPDSYAKKWADKNSIQTDCSASEVSVLAEGNASSTIRWTLYSDGLLAIEGRGSTPNYDYPSSINAPWKNYADRITRVTVSEGITSLGYYFLAHLPNMETVSLPSTLTGMSGGIFAGALSLKSCIVPEGVTSLGWDVFYDCRSMTYLQLPSTLSSISTYEFFNCSSLRRLVLPNKITYLSSHAFDGCTSLRALYLGPNVRSIGTDVFKRCSDQLVIYGQAGSYAQTLASRYGFTFCAESIPDSVDPISVQLTGKVQQQDESGLPGVSVKINDASGVCIADIETDINGRWNCQVSAPAVYTVTYQHEDYTFSSSASSLLVTEDTDFDVVRASFVAGEGAIVPSFTMTMAGEPIPQEGVLTGEPISFSVSAPGATRIRLIADGQPYNEYMLEDGSVTFERAFTQSGTRSISFQAYDDTAWGQIAPEQTLMITALDTLDNPGVHPISAQYVGQPVHVEWDAPEGADSYTVYLYTDRLLWPTLANTSAATTDQTHLTIPGAVINRAGNYLVEVIAAGRGYSQSTGVASFTVLETRANAAITFPENDNAFSLGSQVNVRVAAGAGTSDVRLKIVPPTLPEQYLTPDTDGQFRLTIGEPGIYQLIPCYFRSGDDTSAPIEGQQGETVRIQALAPQIESLVQGPNENYAIGYTGYAFNFNGKLRGCSEVKIHLDGSLLDSVAADSTGRFTTNDITLSGPGKYLFTFTPCCGDLSGKPVVFPVYEYEKQEDCVRYAAVPLSMHTLPDANPSSLIGFGSEITVHGVYMKDFLYVSCGEKSGFIAADSALTAAPLEGASVVTAVCRTKLPYSPLGEKRSYVVSADGVTSVNATVILPDGTQTTLPDCGLPTEDGFLVEVSCEQTGGYQVSFSAAGSEGSPVHSKAFSFVVADTSSEYAGKECWSAKKRLIPTVANLSTMSEIDIKGIQMYCIGSIGDEYLYIHVPNIARDEYITLKTEQLQFTKNTTEYRSVIIVNPYTENDYASDRSVYDFNNIYGLLCKIPGMKFFTALGKEMIEIDEQLLKARKQADYNDITYIYWGGHGLEDGNDQSVYQWGILPKDKDGRFYPYLYDNICTMVKEWDGTINIIIDSCYAGDFVTELKRTLFFPGNPAENPDKVAVLMATHIGSRTYSNPSDGGKFTEELTDYVNDHSGSDLKLSVIAANVDVPAKKVKKHDDPDGDTVKVDPQTTYYGDPDRIFFAEDPSAVK